ncbi:MAG: nucleoside hydrolase [Lachnospiraceae bacterium]|nr:nucleoside hydrolase [Lachnospiraceae bacterium]
MLEEINTIRQHEESDFCTHPVRKILIDTDPGVDDALAIMLCAADPSVQITAITAVAGNVGLNHTLENALYLKEVLGLSHTLVSKGADRPLVLSPGRVTTVHGNDGLGGLSKAPKASPDAVPAWERIYETAVQEKGNLEILALGPLTNLAIALRKHPDLKSLVKNLVIMGGSAGSGNVTEEAEFNAWVDPDACDEVLHSGIPLLLCGLDGLQPAALEFPELDALMNTFQNRGGVTESLAVPIIRFIRHSRKGWGGHHNVCIYDLATAVCFLHPDAAQARSAHLSCVTEDAPALGKTVASAAVSGEACTSQILCSMDKQQYLDAFRFMLTRLSDPDLSRSSV